MKYKTTVGVIIARFQVPHLHSGHRYLIDSVLKKHPQVMILLGVHNGVSSDTDPLDFPTRKIMVQKLYPQTLVCALANYPTDQLWSAEIDRLIAKHFPNKKAILYGSRKCFIPCYHGTHRTKALPEIRALSGTEVRKNVSQKCLSGETFRKGIIYAASNRYPISFQTVDIAIIRDQESKIQVLLGQKEQDNGKFRFIGGFVDPTDESLEMAARRESYEETGKVEIGDPLYIGSYRINDYRYRNASDKIMTAFFVAPYIFGAPSATDDIKSLQWFALKEIEQCIVTEHAELAMQLQKHLRKNK